MELLDLHDDDLLHILPFLDQKNLLAVSKTCTRFKKICLYTSSLWRSFTVNPEPYEDDVDDDDDIFEKKLRLTEDEKEILVKNSHGIHNMRICLDLRGEEELDQQSFELLRQTSKMWDLKTFSFTAVFELFYNNDPHPLDYTFTNGRPDMALYSRLGVKHQHDNNNNNNNFTNCLSEKNIIEMIRNCLTSTTAVKNRGLETLSLHVNSWGEHTHLFRRTLLEVLDSETFSESLKSLSLDCFFPRTIDRRSNVQHQWVRDHICWGYSKVIGQFKNLQKLEINTLYLNPSLLEVLSQSGNVSLQSLTLVAGSASGWFRAAFIPFTVWRTFVQSFPSLKVMIEVDDAVLLQHNRHVALPAFVPVVSWKIYRFHDSYSCLYYNDSQKSMFEMVGNYSETLQNFALQLSGNSICYSDFLEMVTKCSKLQSLHVQCVDFDSHVQSGTIPSITILEIASLPRLWLKFGFLEDHILFPRNWMGSRRENIARLSAEVSQRLGYDWKPEKSRSSFKEEVFPLRYLNPELH